MRRSEVCQMERVQGAHSLAFVLPSNDLFFGTGYKVLQNHRAGSFVPFAKSLYNGRVKLTYFTRGLVPLRMFLAEASSSQCAAVMVSFIRCLMDVRSNSFSALRNVELGLDEVFVDSSANEARIVYLPVVMNNAEVAQGDLGVVREVYEFCQAAMAFAGRAPVSPSAIANAQGYQSGNLEHLLSVFRGQNQNQRAVRATSADDSPKHGALAEYVLSPRGSNGNAPIRIARPQMTLGRSDRSADVPVRGSAMVGREHCRVPLDGRGCLSVTDLNSKNGTFVNGVKLPGGSTMRLEEGSILRLADLQFEVVKAR